MDRDAAPAESSGGRLSACALRRVGQILGGFAGVRAVYLFGSYADGTARPDSDIDLAIVPADDQVRDQVLAMLAALARAGYERVDLVFLDGTDAVLRFQAVSRNQPLYVAADFSHPQYFVRALNEYWDLEPLLQVQHAAYKKRVLRG